ncbi:FecR family protein [Pseudoflavitalea rhizosphaerae]|uniref:FecR family protein n=1 Tax=Pseudoflavitalea rhizosphaerae TaxID=1884793 RepID=UPI000F8D108F|nr:FecR domain-containing protein [Pseudoflavitalea rhizosphaerae]
MPTERIQYLARQFFNNSCTPEEKEELAAWINMPGNDGPLRELLRNAWEEHTPNTDMPEDMSNRLLKTMFREKRKTVRVHYLRWAAAAAVVIIAFMAGWWLPKKEKPVQPIVENSIVGPGSNGAILTLADGSKMVLDSIGNGVIARQGNTSVSINNGQLVYDAAAGAGTTGFNTMTTPKGRQFQLVLPDGTNVWLNAASSITYPTSFSGNERKVSVTGEAYFEVAKNATQPFRVSIPDNKSHTIDVLGTHFNVNAYNDAGYISTTLLEGKIKVGQAILQPGDQANSVGNYPARVIQGMDLAYVMAWKNGLFHFNQTSLQLVMKQLERWYNIDVQYAGSPPELRINGKMDRGLNLQDILLWLSKNNVRTEMKGKTVIVYGQ